MCGRFVGFRNVEQLKQYFPIDDVKCEATENYNVAPSQKIIAIARIDEANVLDQYHWGLVPHWAKDISIGYKMINARSETIDTKPSFREAFKKRRCLILADGFYEWAGQKGNKQPVFITLPDKSPFAFAGLWETWNEKGSHDEVYRSCTIITREAIGAVRKIHHRMPVILPSNVYNDWLDPEHGDLKALKEMLGTKAVTDLKFYPVDKQVNSVKTNKASNLEPVQMELDF